MQQYDVIVIGGGILGCFAARNLRRWNISAALVEAENDICTGITRASSAICYAGYDNQPGSLKARMTVAANAAMDTLCRELDVPFVRCGSLMVSFGPEADRTLQKKLEQGRTSGVPGLRLISGDEALEMEPMLAKNVRSALYSKTTGTVNPWLLGIAAFENAVHNGCTPLLNTQVLGIEQSSSGYVVKTNREELSCKAILNCAGLSADRIQELLFAPSVRLFPDGADYLVLEKGALSPKHIIFHESEEKGKGITAIPTEEGNLLLQSPARTLTAPFATTADGLQDLEALTAQVLPAVELGARIRSFGTVRPNPHRVTFQNGRWMPDGKRLGSFVIENPVPGFYSLIGIKTPGMTCANQLGTYLAQQCALYLDAAPNLSFDPCRKAITQARNLSFEQRAAMAAANPDYGEILCQCQDISKAEVLEAIGRGAVTADGVKRRLSSGMGYCQGSRCTRKIEALLEGVKHGPL